MMSTRPIGRSFVSGAAAGAAAMLALCIAFLCLRCCVGSARRNIRRRLKGSRACLDLPYQHAIEAAAKIN